MDAATSLKFQPKNVASCSYVHSDTWTIQLINASSQTRSGIQGELEDQKFPSVGIWPLSTLEGRFPGCDGNTELLLWSKPE